jgi:hypothetical protein
LKKGKTDRTVIAKEVRLKQSMTDCFASLAMTLLYFWLASAVISGRQLAPCRGDEREAEYLGELATKKWTIN